MHFIRKRKELVIILSILAVAAFFRLCKLDVMPPGLWPDEAANGVDALKALDERNFKIFYPANNGREGLFINIQAVSIHFFGANPWSLRVVSAIFGIFTVLGLYLLTRYMFNWRVAAVASFFMAISFWHVNFSRIGFRAIMLPFILVWAFYFLWRGLRTNRLWNFFMAGLIGGIGFYTYFSFRMAPLIVIILFLNHWAYLKKDFSHTKYEHSRSELLRGFTLMMLTVIIVALPMAVYFYTHPEDFLKRDGRPISVFAQENPLKELALSTIRTLGMFNFSGDWNQRHNIPGWPQLSLPIGILFAVGFLRELYHWIRRKHGHFSTLHTFLFTWFFVMLLPGFLSIEAPHALRTIGVIPVVMIFAAQGFWWMINFILRWNHMTDIHARTDIRAYRKETRLIIGGTILIFMSSLFFIEGSRYFKQWAREPTLKSAFAQTYIDIADYINNNTSPLPKYVLVNEGDVMVDGVANNAQTIKFLTRTHSAACSDQKFVYYLNPDQLNARDLPQRFELIPLADNAVLKDRLFWSLGFYPENHGSFTVYKK
jgi:4-amino-4-deoxy-L-arabinose transferase-like glycosyltransferase